AGNDERPARAVLLQLRQLEDRVDRFLAGAVDEGARVDDDALGVLGRRRERKAGLGQHAEHELGIDLVLRAAERRQMDLHGWERYTVQARRARRCESLWTGARWRDTHPPGARSSAVCRRSSRTRRPGPPGSTPAPGLSNP